MGKIDNDNIENNRDVDIDINIDDMDIIDQDINATENNNIDIIFDVIVVGGGPGGLAAAKSAALNGAKVLLLEREKQLGGILNQCIHDGFGLVRYNKQLSGPEYAERAVDEIADCDITVMLETIVTNIKNTCDGIIITAIHSGGIKSVLTKSLVLATGCRERTRGMIGIPGARPAGIYTAGVAQNLINVKNLMVGRKVVLYGTGDIGLIMARRLILEGAEVVCAVEIKDDASGLSRNVKQCIQDYSIPIYLEHEICNIIGKNRIEAVEVRPVHSEELSEHKELQERTELPECIRIECDTLILSVGLIPENEIAKTAGVKLNKKTNGIETNDALESNIEGIFACGNCRSVMDLADYVSMQGEKAGANAAHYALKHNERERWGITPHNISRKGIPDENSLTCTLCPRGCEMTIECIEENDCGSKSQDVAYSMSEYCIDNTSRSASDDNLRNSYDGELQSDNNRKSQTSKECIKKIKVRGNFCKRGIEFAEIEKSSPQRIFTSTVKAYGNKRHLIPVRSDRPVLLEEMRTIGNILRQVTVELPIKSGQVVVSGVGKNEVNIVAECNIES